jgi:hypothetical protein
VYITTPFDLQYQRVLRYFQKSFDYATPPAQNSGAFSGLLTYRTPVAGVSTITTYAPFQVPMRTAAPSVTFYNPSAANNKWRNISLAADSGVPLLTANGEKSQGFGNPQVAGDAIGNNIAIHWTADARF